MAVLAAREVKRAISLIEGVLRDIDARPWDRAEASISANRPEHTAIGRRECSAPAREVVDVIVPDLRVRSVLDYGCGRGADVDWYRENGLTAKGFDPHPPFGFETKPTSTFDLVTCVYVLNVIDDVKLRRDALDDAGSFVGRGGALLVVTRSASSIAREAATEGWARRKDGWWSSTSRGTFQHGLDPGEIVSLARSVGLTPHRHEPDVRLASDAAWALLARAR